MQPPQSQTTQEANEYGDATERASQGIVGKKRMMGSDERQASLKRMRMLLGAMKVPSLGKEGSGGSAMHEDTLRSSTPLTSSPLPAATFSSATPLLNYLERSVRSDSPSHLPESLLEVVHLHSFNRNLPAEPFYLRHDDIWTSRDDLILAAHAFLRHNGHQCHVFSTGDRGRYLDLRCCCSPRADDPDRIECRVQIIIEAVSEDHDVHWRVKRFSGLNSPGHYDISTIWPLGEGWHLTAAFNRQRSIETAARKEVRAEETRRAKAAREEAKKAAKKAKQLLRTESHVPCPSPSSLSSPPLSLPSDPADIVATAPPSSPPTAGPSSLPSTVPVPQQVKMTKAEKKAKKVEREILLKELTEKLGAEEAQRIARVFGQ